MSYPAIDFQMLEELNRQLVRQVSTDELAECVNIQSVLSTLQFEPGIRIPTHLNGWQYHSKSELLDVQERTQMACDLAYQLGIAPIRAPYHGDESAVYFMETPLINDIYRVDLLRN